MHPHYQPHLVHCQRSLVCSWPQQFSCMPMISSTAPSLSDMPVQRPFVPWCLGLPCNSNHPHCTKKTASMLLYDLRASVLYSGLLHCCQPKTCYKGKIGKRGYCRLSFWHWLPLDFHVWERCHGTIILATCKCNHDISTLLRFPADYLQSTDPAALIRQWMAQKQVHLGVLCQLLHYKDTTPPGFLMDMTSYRNTQTTARPRRSSCKHGPQSSSTLDLVQIADVLPTAYTQVGPRNDFLICWATQRLILHIPSTNSTSTIWLLDSRAANRLMAHTSLPSKPQRHLQFSSSLKKAFKLALTPTATSDSLSSILPPVVITLFAVKIYRAGWYHTHSDFQNNIQNSWKHSIPTTASTSNFTPTATLDSNCLENTTLDGTTNSTDHRRCQQTRSLTLASVQALGSSPPIASQLCRLHHLVRSI